MQFLRAFAAASFSTLGIIIALSYLVQPVSGDLTRVGHLAEREFGWNRQQVELAPADNTSRDPDLIVLGDSFSKQNLWQSALTRGSRKVLTLSWEGLGRPPRCLSHWLQLMHDVHRTAGTVVLQTAERLFLDRFLEIDAPCDQALLRKASIASPGVAPLRWRPMDLQIADPVYAVMATVNMIRDFNTRTRVGQVTVAPLTRRDLFSSRRPDRLLYFSEDDYKLQWSASALGKALSNAKRVQEVAAEMGVRLVIVVVPDKSTAYRNYRADLHSLPINSADIWHEFDDKGVIHVNLRDRFEREIERTIDLYLPNDTHLSSDGFAIMGAEVAAFLGYP